MIISLKHIVPLKMGIARVLLLSAFMCSIAMTLFSQNDPVAKQPLPVVWTNYRKVVSNEVDFADLKAHGVQLVSMDASDLTDAEKKLQLARQYGMKYSIDLPDITERADLVKSAGLKPVYSLMIGGVYLGKAIDRHLFKFKATKNKIIIEPPVYSKELAYKAFGGGTGAPGKGEPIGHYYPDMPDPVKAEIIVPLQRFDGKQHLCIVEAKVTLASPDLKPEFDTCTPDLLYSSEIKNRKLYQLSFDLCGFKNALLDQVGIAVYWPYYGTNKYWLFGHGNVSAAAPSTHSALGKAVQRELSTWTKANGGRFPSDVVVAARYGDECFYITGHSQRNGAMGVSYPLWDYSKPSVDAFHKYAGDIEYPRTWGFPEIYGEKAYGWWLYNLHEQTSNLVRTIREEVAKTAPDLKLFRNTTRNGVFDLSNNFDGSGQELLARNLDIVHLDPYPVIGGGYSKVIPRDMSYCSGLARRYNRPLIPWMQAHVYAQLQHVTPAQVDTMAQEQWAQGVDGIIWLGYGDTYPAVRPDSWERASEFHRRLKTGLPAKPKAKLAVLRSYNAMASGSLWEDGKIRNPSDWLLQQFLEVWVMKRKEAYDVFELPPDLNATQRMALEKDLKNYQYIVSLVPWDNAWVINAPEDETFVNPKEAEIWQNKFDKEIELRGWAVKNSSLIKDQRKTLNFDGAWRFFYGDNPQGMSQALDDANWKLIDLPHDWSINMPVSIDHTSGKHGGFYAGGVGWYRKHFRLPKKVEGNKVYLLFDGLYMNSEVWLNGKRVGRRSYGYVSHYYDVSKFIDYDHDNVLAIRIDVSKQPSDRWYSGAGIYRHVYLIVTSQLHIPVWGTSIVTPMVKKEEATVRVNNLVVSGEPVVNGSVTTIITSPDGIVLDQKTLPISMDRNDSIIVSQDFKVINPRMWGPESPYIYNAATILQNNGKVTDSVKNTFGIRTIDFSPDSGFILNGKKEILKGVCIHHDLGSLGAAVDKDEIIRRLRILKEMGCNAVRLSHNPYSPEVLSACDSLGLLVFDELYDKWDEMEFAPKDVRDSFDKIWQNDLKDFIDRDRNHPSVFIWSMGNETEEQLNHPEKAVDIYREMEDFVHRYEPTRKVTVALHPANSNKKQEVPSRLIHESDVVSYNYRTRDFTEYHEKFPEIIFLASETRPYTDIGKPDFTEDLDHSGNSWFDLKNFVAGQFIWSGFDYLGEAGRWPYRGWQWGLINTCGFRKPASYYTQSIYSDKPMIRLAVFDDSLAHTLDTMQTSQIYWASQPVASHWNFHSKDGPMKVFAFTNCEEAELLINNKSQGTKRLVDFKDRVVRWKVAYEEGSVLVIGRNKGKDVVRHELTTAGTPSHIKLSAEEFQAIPGEILHINVDVCDTNGNLCPKERVAVEFQVDGGTIAGVDNGDLSCHFDYRANNIETREGRALLLVRASKGYNKLIVRAVSSGIKDGEIVIPVMPQDQVTILKHLR